MASRNPRRIVFLIDQASLSLHYDQPQFVDQRKSFAIHIIQHACLKLLTFLGRSDFNGSFSWGYTFFNSLGFSVKQAEKRGFRIFSADTVNEFRCAVESNIIKYDTDIKCKEEGIAHSENISSKMFNVTEGKTTANVLHYALKNVLCDFQWDTPDIISPVKYKGNRKYCEECPKENYIFVISVCPLSVQEVQRFCGQKLQISSGPRKLLDSFLPKALFSVLRNEAKVRLFWLDTSVLLFKKELSTKENEDYEDDPSFGINLMHKSLSFVDGGVIPLQAFSPSSHLHPTCSVYNQCIYRDEIEGKGYWNPHCSLILPITTVAAFYLGRDKNQREQLNSATKSKTVSLILNSGSQRPLFWKLNIVKQELVNIRLCNLPKKEFVCMNTKDVGFQPELSMETCVSLPYTTGLFQWNIITVKRLVPRNTKLLLSVGKCIFLCYPVSDCSTEQQTSFSSLMVELATCGQILLVECTEESDNRVSVCGVLCPLTSSSATLSILSPVDTDTMYKQTCSIFAKQEESLSQFGDQEDTTCEQFQNFQSSSLESWFPSQPIDLELQEKLSGCRDVTREDSKMLQALQILYRPKYPSLKGSSWKVKEKAKSEQATFCEVRRSPRLRKCRSVTLNVSLRSANMVHKSVNTQKRNISTKYKQLGDVEFCKSSQKIQEVAKGQSDKKQIISSTDLTGQGFTDENQLVSHLKEVYNMAIEGETSLLSSVQTLVNLVLYFVKDKKQFEVAARELMDKHFLLSAKQINTKYEENLEPGAKNKRIKEYKIQALFALEMEAAMPSESTVEETVKKIVGLLRTMSFLSGPSVLNEFLLETVKDNYSHNLKDILLELGDELNIPIFPELCSPEKPLNNQSKFLGEDLFPEKYVPDSVSSGSTDSVTSRHERR
ncbi:treslin-like isoform X2 [Tachypleus tridentatus]|uniref:treslin-like isoform X2 n=1 Tax=Tachypleus tridentatus TaxID=6853 RepID=UPI003FD1E193